MKESISLFFCHCLLGGILGWFSCESQPAFFGAVAAGSFLYVLSCSLNLEKKPLFTFGFFFSFSLCQNLWMKDLSVPQDATYLFYFGPFLTLFFSLWIAMQSLVAVNLASSLQQKKKIFGFIGLWTLLEYHRSFFLCGYNFYTVSSFLEKFPMLDKIFAFTGVFGATLLLLLVSLLLFDNPKKRANYRALFIIVTLLFVPQFKTTESKIRVGVVQTARDPWGMDDKLYLEKYLTWLKGVKDLDLLVFSETSLPTKYFLKYPDGMTMGELLDCYSLESAIINLSFNKNIDVIVGHIYPGENGKHFNVATLVHKGEVVGRYDKNRLMSVMEKSWDFLPDSFKSGLGTGDFLAGKKKGLLKGKYLYGINICYDDYFGSDSNVFSKKGADLIVSIHNDIWVQNEDFKTNHFRQTLLRSIETGLPSIRTANGGFSGYTLPDGEYAFFPPGEGVKTFSITLSKNLTLYPYLQDRIFVFIAFLLFIWGFREKFEKNYRMRPRRD